MPATTWCSFLDDSSFAKVVSLLGVRNLAAGGLLGSPPSRGPTIDTRMLVRWVAHVTGKKPEEAAPDLGQVLDDRGFEGPGREDLRTFEELLAPRKASLFVGRCVVDAAGFFAVSVYRSDAPGPQVRVGDEFFSGVQLTGAVDSGEVIVEPHVLRRVCVNGAAVQVATEGGAYVRSSASEVDGDLAEVVEIGFSGRLARAVEADLRRASATPAPRIADLRARGLLRLSQALATSIEVAARAEEPTVFGLFNAITRVARDTRDPRTAVALERTAGRLVALLLRNRERALEPV